MEGINLSKLTALKIDREEAKRICLENKVPLDKYFEITDEVINSQEALIKSLQELNEANEELIKRYEAYILDLGGKVEERVTIGMLR